MNLQYHNRTIGDGEPCYIIGEIGLNHNGHIDLAQKMIETSARLGFDCVKLQKRTVDEVYTEEVLARPREGPFGDTYGDEKWALEFEADEYAVIATHCEKNGIHWSASCWDEKSVEFIASMNPPFLKVPSPCIFNSALLDAYADTGLPIMMSTGLCEIDDVDKAVEHFDRSKLVLMHCVSSYPAPTDQLNISAVETLRKRYGCLVGYSGHEEGLAVTSLSIPYGACVIERHITMSRTMHGSDHAASIEPVGMEKLVRYIRASESALGDGEKRIMECEDMEKRLALKGS